jgi:hypothetical protein
MERGEGKERSRRSRCEGREEEGEERERRLEGGRGGTLME